MSFIAKQQYVKAKGLRARIEIILMIVVKAILITLSNSILLNSSKDKTIEKHILEELIKDMKELKIKMNTLKKNTKISTSQSVERSKRFVVRYIWCNDLNQK